MTGGRTIGAALLLAAVVLGPARAMEQRALPDFKVRDASGQWVPSAVFGAEPRVLAIYASTSCGACGPLWAAMREWDVPQMAPRTLVIVGGPAQAAADVRDRLPQELAGIRVFADPDGSARQALRLTSDLSILGIERGGIRWGLAGVLNDPKALQSALTTWVTKDPPPVQ